MGWEELYIWYVAQPAQQIDAGIAEKGHFGMETRSFVGLIPHKQS